MFSCHDKILLCKYIIMLKLETFHPLNMFFVPVEV